VHRERPGEEAAKLDQRLRIGALAHRHVEPPFLLAGREQAVAAGEGIRDADRGGGLHDLVLTAGDDHRRGSAAGGGPAGLTTWSFGCGVTLGGTVPI
jgi:hypothetical protein